MTVPRALCAALALALAAVAALGATGAQEASAAGVRRLARGLDGDTRLWAVSVRGGLIGYSSGQPPAGSRLRPHCRHDTCRENAYVTDTRSGRSRQIGAQSVHNHELLQDAFAGSTRRFAYTAYTGFPSLRSRFPVYLYDRRSGRSRRILSPRGRAATFLSADHLTLLAETVVATPDQSRPRDVYAYDLARGRARPVNIDSGGRRLPGEARMLDASADGRLVLLEVAGPCPAACDTTVAYLRDLRTATTTRVTPAGAAIDGQVSDDGQMVLINTDAALSADDTNDVFDCYLWTPSGGLSPAVPFALTERGNECALSPHGRWLAIVTQDPLDQDDTDRRNDVYVKALPAGQPRRISGALGRRAREPFGAVRFAPDDSFLAWVGEARVGEGAIYGAPTGG